MKRYLQAIILTFIISLFCTSCTKTEKNYYPDGALQSSIQYKGKKENGKSYYYYQAPNTLEIEIDMKNGKRNGEFKRYYMNGGLDTYCTYTDDEIEGLEVMYTPNGEKSQEFTYVHGKKNGPHKAYHLNGEIKIEGNFKDDLFDGKWNYYDERGILVGEGTFNNGNGKLDFYGPRGLIIRSTQYVANKKDGKEIYYDNEGKIIKEIVFKQDRIVSESVDSSNIK